MGRRYASAAQALNDEVLSCHIGRWPWHPR
jgi:hypothetical protein